MKEPRTRIEKRMAPIALQCLASHPIPTSLHHRFPINFQNPWDQLFPRIGRCPHASFRSHSLTQGWIRQEAFDSVRNGLGIPGWHEQPRLSVLHDVHDAANSRRDNWEAGGHRFQENDSERFEQRREAEKSGSAKAPSNSAAAKKTLTKNPAPNPQSSPKGSKAPDPPQTPPTATNPHVPLR